MLKVQVVQDHDPINPREGDNLGTMICAHKKYHLGDEQIQTSGNYDSWDEVQEALIPKNATVLPLYLYDHSGITMNTTGFSCGWDSGQVGFIYISDPLARTLLEWKRITRNCRTKIKEYLRQEVDRYDKYLRGDIWGYEILDEKDFMLESCYGIDDEDYALEQGNNCLEALVKAKV